MIQLPKDLLTQNYTKPKVFLCEVDKTKICQLETTNLQGTFKFNAYSEISFTVGRMYTNIVTGKTSLNPFYDKIEALRLIYLEGFGYFEIQDPEIVSDGVQEVKNITAYSLEYTLSQKYLEEFTVNTGELSDIGVDSNGNMIVITLYNPNNKKASLLDLILEKVYGWTIKSVDSTIQGKSRTFEISRVSVYDFIMQDICEKFNCYAVFDTINNTIELHAESLISKDFGDGVRTSFKSDFKFDQEHGSTVSIDGYKVNVTEYTYEHFQEYGKTKSNIIFKTPPANGALVEIIDGAQQDRLTDVYVSFQNLAQEVNISYSADDIKTVLTVKGADDLDIREVNMGLPYIVDLSYYCSEDWMGQELHDAYTKYLQKCSELQPKYSSNAQTRWKIEDQIVFEQERMSLKYDPVEDITKPGEYYIKGGTAPYYYYKKVTLPEDYQANVDYYKLSDVTLNKTKFLNLYEALCTYFSSANEKNTGDIESLKNDFAFMETYTIDYLVDALKKATTKTQQDTAIVNFLDETLDQLGLFSLQSYYDGKSETNPETGEVIKGYMYLKETSIEAGEDSESHQFHWRYCLLTLITDTLSKEIEDREKTIDDFKKEVENIQQENNNISNQLLLDVFFTQYYMDKGLTNKEAKDGALSLLIRLSAFLREDEYTDDNFLVTEIDTIESTMQTKHELLECGRIELQKLCEPKLAFSMDMANIYAMPEFESIINQFDLGNLISIELRPKTSTENAYVKQARLLQVDFNFEDFSDFSCEFGELTSLRTPSSIHADLLSNALSAGKSVASNASYWQKGTDTVTSLALKIQQGLLDASTAIKAIDGNQGVVIDSTGIHLRKYDEATGALDPKEGWIINNQFLYSADNFKTAAKSVFGEYTVEGQTFWGLIAEAVMAGYVVGCTIEGGTIKIGEQKDGIYAFEVRSDGSVVMNGGNTIAGYTREEDIEDLRKMQEDVYQNFEFNKNNGLTIGQTDNAFYVNINSQEMGFYDNSDTNSPNQKVVNIGNKSATIQNAVFQGSSGTTFENNVTFEQQINMHKPDTTAGFAWKIEQNGSLSLAITS